MHRLKESQTFFILHFFQPVLINGIDRTVEDEYNVWIIPLDSWIELDFGREINLNQVRIIFDNDLNHETCKNVDHNFKTFSMK